ncbi:MULTISPECIES: O-antigen ligase RfaL [Enterobacteriaceae]|uniref:O-antigen ligase RfaL n=1 Tax=Enterobacteriaceae TaxID=543 RepID=UPI0015DD0B05|nr:MULTISPECIES: O-antigen ligase RfaL [unclassified Klebsiella]HAT3954203.1 O-antigen ligase RfaL [Kluyvera ascorbata]BBR56824.1 O-antigen ligase [Klebsiella sp. WP4-W18-ESBL-05]BBS89585.1 O-antigen ligase [Klebsiella sp. WP7-S18-CRE-02]BBS94607.1 O-antigen ligase [Klebsiella sp. WP7-S18-CRE-03]BBS99637.1 O-antigen ligase [Klebsiella sp. WP7-S18-ESBL-04]
MNFLASVKHKEACWQSIWNRGLVSLFIIMNFFDHITRYKHAVTGLMLITALYYVAKKKTQLLSIFKNNLTYALLCFVAVCVYAVAISVDPAYSLSKFANTVLEKLLLMTLLIPILLHEESKENVARTLIYSLIVGILPLAIADGWQYYREYQQGIMPLTDFAHKYRSDILIFMAPAFLFLWNFKTTKARVLFFAIACVMGFMIVGTLQRGTWLAILIPAFIWCVIKREWKLPLLAAVLLGGVLVTGYLKDRDAFKLLFHKMQQTSSSYRYGGGTQGSALDLIMENPIKGYGYGEDIFYRVYNSRVHDYPQWFFKQSIGPHNLTLSMWYAGGLLGLFAVWYLLISLLTEAVKGYRASQGIIKEAWLLIGLILVGNLFVRGAFETVSIENLTMLLGIALTLKARSQQH